MPIGFPATRQSMILSIKSEFTQILSPPNGGSFPSGTTAWIELWDNAGANLLDTWNATVATATASWQIPPSQANAIPANSRYRMYVQYPGSPSYPQEWMLGPVLRVE